MPSSHRSSPDQSSVQPLRSSPNTGAVVCSALSFSWPDGTPVFNELSASFGTGRMGLVGNNGSGKSTLLQLIAGRLQPSSGSATITGRFGYLSQGVTLDVDLRVDQALGIAEQRAAIAAIVSGEVDEVHFEVIGEDWDIEERARATLGSLGLGAVDLDRTVGQLSGGEAVLLCLAALLLDRPDVVLLDEPTNNLDLFARQRLYQAIDNWRSGSLIVVSHDRELLEHVDAIAELRSGRLSWYGGGWTAYTEAVSIQQESAERSLRAAEADVRRQKRELEETQVKLARRQRNSKKLAAQHQVPRIVAGAKKRAAQESAGKLRRLQQDRLATAREHQDEAAEAVRVDAEIRVDLPHSVVPSGRRVLELRDLDLTLGGLRGANLEIHGPERIALIGRNGSGKTTLLRTLAGELAPANGTAKIVVPFRFLPQRLDVLDDQLSVVANAAAHAAEASQNQLRAQLAHFLFRGSRADQLAGTLSGGERFRAALATMMLATPAPQLLILDEPTNNLDLASVRQLVTALQDFAGSLLVASHDVPFLKSIGITRWLLLEEELIETSADDLDQALAVDSSPPVSNDRA